MITNFDPYDYASVLTNMNYENELGKHRRDLRGVSRIIPQDFNEFSQQRLARRTSGMIPTLYGKIMQKRHGGIQGRGIAGAIGKSGMPSDPGLEDQQNLALLEQYPNSPALAMLRRTYASYPGTL